MTEITRPFDRVLLSTSVHEHRTRVDILDWGKEPVILTKQGYYIPNAYRVASTMKGRRWICVTRTTKKSTPEFMFYLHGKEHTGIYKTYPRFLVFDVFALFFRRF